MITAYHRPKTMEEALSLLGRTSPHTVPLGGGTLLSHGQPDAVEVVDLQALGLDHISEQGNILEIGAAATLQSLLEHASCPEALRKPLKLEAPLNLRNSATVGGTLVTCDGRSTFTTALLALDAKLSILRLGAPAGTASKASRSKPRRFSPLASRGADHRHHHSPASAPRIPIRFPYSRRQTDRLRCPRSVAFRTLPPRCWRVWRSPPPRHGRDRIRRPRCSRPQRPPRCHR